MRRRRGRHERRPDRRRLRRGLLLGLLVGSCAATAGALIVLALLASLPGVGDAQDRVDAMLAEHGGRPVGLPLPGRVARSLVAVEDQRFYAHRGVDPRSVARLAWSGLRGGDLRDEGGSTIAQQLAKRLYTGDRPGLAIKLERRWSKDQLLGMYLDAAYFGGGHWGIVQASQGYFGRPPARLSWGEASLLAGLVQAPSSYDPTVHLAAAKRRQRHVLDRLVAAGVLRRAEADTAGRGLAAEARRLGFRTVQDG